MKRPGRIQILIVVALGLAVSAGAQERASASTDAVAKALNMAMTPGEGQQRLEFMVGTFEVKVRTWVDPSKPPIESTAMSVASWVLDKRYVQQMLAGSIQGEPWSGIGYVGFDNVAKKYVVTYMDSGSTGMLWFTGTMDESGKTAKLTATTLDEVTGKPVPAEMRLSIAANGDSVTELWLGDTAGKMSKVDGAPVLAQELVSDWDKGGFPDANSVSQAPLGENPAGRSRDGHVRGSGFGHSRRPAADRSRCL